MRKYPIYLPELALVGATRGMLGFGLGLLLSKRIARARRRPVGTSLVVAGVLSTIPLALRVFGRGTIEGGSRRDRRRAEAVAGMAG